MKAAAKAAGKAAGFIRRVTVSCVADSCLTRTVQAACSGIIILFGACRRSPSELTSSPNCCLDSEGTNTPLEGMHKIFGRIGCCFYTCGLFENISPLYSLFFGGIPSESIRNILFSNKSIGDDYSNFVQTL